MPLGSIIILVVLGFGVYLNSLTGSFIWDDNSLISGNYAIKSWSGIADIFTKGNISSYTGKALHIYRPVQMLTYMADYAMWGLSPIGYHFTNALLHVLTALSLYWLINLLSSDRLISFASSALFVAHPIHTEAVSYISGRSDLLSALLAILSFICYIKYVRKTGAGAYIMVLLTYILSIFSRENIIILPIIFIAYNHSFRKKTDLKLMVPLILTGLGYAALRLTSLKHLLADYNAVYKTTVIQRLPGFFAAVGNYVKLLMLPRDLHMEYGNGIFSFSSVVVIFGAAVLAALIYAALRFRASRPLATFAILWFLIALLPVSNLYPIGAYMAEHWLYFPSIGLFLAAGLCLRSLCATKRLKIAAIVILAALIGVYSRATIKQNLYWQDPVDFYERTLKYAPESMRAGNDAAMAYEKAGMHDEATSAYMEMLRQDPDHPDVYVNLAAIQIVKGNYGKAIELCERATELEWGNATAHNNLAVAYYMQGKYDLAIEHCDLAVKYGYKVKDALIELLRPYKR